MTGDRDDGAMPLWTLGLAVIVLAVGALGLDLWQVLAARQELVAIADAVAYAGASGIDEDRLRATNEVVLDQERVRQLGADALAAQDLPASWQGIRVDVVAGAVRVSVAGRVEGILLPLLGVESLEIAVESAARPILR